MAFFKSVSMVGEILLFQAPQTKYEPYDLKLTGIVLACRKLHYYMSSCLPFVVHMDHKAVDKLENVDFSVEDFQDSTG